jgi:hypothetical protein
MKTTQSSGARPVYQTVAGEFEFKAAGKSIAISFTDQQLSPHAGSAAFWTWLGNRITGRSVASNSDRASMALRWNFVATKFNLSQ